ncbi:hypothetical protein CEUSTIGMA_g3450.t1 [Chlamydomonas eustigma]|uniref:AB hydrolase-1 domain-containing protein n=1 Tax=Chlamydomonas eustigma TaxID=1157962 RepID=A0A250WYT8_9CHLO|nr:hypothetical protein CEUSTIGMA_g3450.t1 [Chlamydomonas eustigma]|eukprot:GAX76007.1 hypothetical protein CEUSTIGMA_g3450.t1 [Chlamydomonas eustigma]
MQLSGIRPYGWFGAFLVMLYGIPVWAYQAIHCLLQFQRKPAYKTSSLSMRPVGAAVEHPVGTNPDISNWSHETLLISSSQRIHIVSPKRKPTKQLILFVHGFPECWYSWRHQMEEFKDDYDTVAMDMRGYNLSDIPEGVDSYSLDKLISDIPALVRALGHTSCTLVAHDWGGVVAWLVAAGYPEIVERLVVMAAPHLGLSQTNISIAQALKSWYMIFFQMPYLPELVLQRKDCDFLRMSFRDGPMGVVNKHRITDEDIQIFKNSFKRPGAITAAINYYRALLRHMTIRPISSVWSCMRRRIEVPVLLLWGKRDGALGVELIYNIKEVAPKVETEMLDCSHWVQQDEPDEVNSLMRKFLEKQD